MKKRAAFIVRVSTDKQSNERQIDNLRLLAKDYRVEPEDIYADIISGKTSGDTRPELSRLFATIENKPKGYYSAIFSDEVSRIGRSPEDSRKTVEKFVSENIPVFIPKLGWSVLDNGERNPMFHVFYQLLAEDAARELTTRAHRQITGALNKVRNGHAGGGSMLPYGYKRDDNKQMVIDREEAAIIKKIFNWVISGLGGKQIAHKLNELKVPTRAQKSLTTKKGLKLPNMNVYKPLSNIKWSDGVVHKILSNTIYYGERNYKGEILKAPAIITRDLWMDVQDTMKQRLHKTERLYTFIMKHILYCGVCGKRYVGRYKETTGDCYYGCSSTREKSCGNGGIGIEAVESCVWSILHNKEVLMEYLKNSGAEISEAKTNAEKTKVDLEIEQTELKSLNAKSKKIRELYVEGHYDKTEFNKEIKKLNITMSSKNERIKLLQQRIKSLNSIIDKYDSKEFWSKELYSERFQDRLIIQKCVAGSIDKAIVTAVNQQRNNHKFLVSIFFKLSKVPLNIFIITKQRNQKLEEFIFTGTAELQKNKGFVYLKCDEQDKVKYGEDGILLSDPKLLLDKQFKDEFGKPVENTVVVPYGIPFKGEVKKVQRRKLKVA